MSSGYYEAGPGRAARVGDLFARIAPRYDLINDLQSFGLHRVWKRKLIRLAGLGQGQTALDLCCGTGDVALSLAGQGVRTVGLDFSRPMLEIARQRLRSWNPGRSATLGGLELLQGDAIRLPFADASFDAVTISYGLRNLADYAAGLREMLRVTRRGGQVLILDFGKPDHPAWRALYFGYLRRGVPLFGRLFCGDASTHSYILTSLQHYPAQQGVHQTLQELGCQEARIVPILGGVMTINLATKP